ncbi:MAG: tRNA-dihydrouridine synthase C [bacterium ADurb.Bin243]|nr:MAG: tRNA-dihydrouridine synthase C [bacterium ADurb.Bin243]HOD39962.1 tRNA dihydrouridine synthase DusB [Candidatus Wallbacteria bacterium]
MNNENYIRELNIGKVRLENNLILAPLAGVTDYPFRLICRALGAGLTVSEMVHVTALTYKSKTTPTLTKRSEAERPFSIQLFGNKPEHFANSVRFIIRNRLSELIDINMGCPAKQVVTSGSGSYLMKQPALAREIIKACVDASAEFGCDRVPITVKMRLGWDLDSINAVDYVKMAEDLGAEMVTVHARTYSMRFSGTPLYHHVAECKKAVKIPVVVNGDINLYDSIKKVLDITGADGVMIGRAAMGRIWIFNDILRQAAGKRMLDFSIADVIKLMKLHGRLVGTFYSDINGVLSFRKQLLWYTKGWYDSARLRERLKLVESPDEIDEILDEYLNRIGNLALPENKIFNVYEKVYV